MFRLLCLYVSIISSLNCIAQGYVDQKRVEPLLNSQLISVDSISPVSWHVYVYHADSNSKNKFQNHLDSLPGMRKELRTEIIELANRKTIQHFYDGMEVIVPDSFPEDYKVYSPYPFLYHASDTLSKLFFD